MDLIYSTWSKHVARKNSQNSIKAACDKEPRPSNVANEGRCVIFVPESDVGHALEVLRSHRVSAGAAQAGTVHEHRSGIVTVRSRIGGHRVLDMLSGEQLPRIC